jgi:hypothetical protein
MYILALLPLLTHLTDFSLQPVLNESNGLFAAFDSQNGDESGMNFLYEQLSSKVQSRSLNVANWPNVSSGRVRRTSGL